MQAELLHLESRMEAVKGLPELHRLDQSWIELGERSGKGSNDGWRRLFEESREKLDDYCRSSLGPSPSVLLHFTDGHGADQALLQTAQVNSLESPKTYDVNFLRVWYDDKRGGNDFLRGVEAGIFREEEAEADMVILKAGGSAQDSLAECLKQAVPLYHRLIGHRIHRSLRKDELAFWDYPESVLVKVGNAICMLLSAIIPALSIFVLYTVQSMVSRLIAITIMSFLFSVIMTVVAQRRADVFTATTAFAAVLVVFVGSANSIVT